MCIVHDCESDYSCASCLISLHFFQESFSFSVASLQHALVGLFQAARVDSFGLVCFIAAANDLLSILLRVFAAVQESRFSVCMVSPPNVATPLWTHAGLGQPPTDPPPLAPHQVAVDIADAILVASAPSPATST